MIILGFLLISYLISHFRNIAYDALQNLFFREKDRIVVLDDLPLLVLFFFFFARSFYLCRRIANTVMVALPNHGGL